VREVLRSGENSLVSLLFRSENVSSRIRLPGLDRPAEHLVWIYLGMMARAEALSRDKGLRLTPVRRRTLEILLEAHRALGAYDVLNRLSAEGYGNQPPVSYRALEFLVEQEHIPHL
jgi:hypothetical protein